jgi:hypothetical protein
MFSSLTDFDRIASCPTRLDLNARIHLKSDEENNA